MNDDTHSGTVAAPSGDLAQPPAKSGGGGGGANAEPRLPQAGEATLFGTAQRCT